MPARDAPQSMVYNQGYCIILRAECKSRLLYLLAPVSRTTYTHKLFTGHRVATLAKQQCVGGAEGKKGIGEKRDCQGKHNV